MSVTSAELDVTPRASVHVRRGHIETTTSKCDDALQEHTKNASRNDVFEAPFHPDEKKSGLKSGKYSSMEADDVTADSAVQEVRVAYHDMRSERDAHESSATAGCS